jgi:hypothetical protein
MPEVPKPPDLAKRGGCRFQCGRQQLQIGIETDFASAKKAHLAFKVVNVSAIAEWSLGYGILSRHDRLNPARKQMFVDDSWGNLLQFTE